MKNRDYLTLNKAQQKWLRLQLQKASKPPKALGIEVGRTSKAVNNVLAGATGFSAFWLNAFASTLDRDKHTLHRELNALLEEPAPASMQSSTPRQSISDEELFSNCFAKLSFVERDDTHEKMQACLAKVMHRLERHPNDIFLRALVSWAILRRGSSEQLIAIAEQTAEYLTTTNAAPIFEIDSEDWERTMGSIQRGELAESNFVRLHLEDALMRATLLRRARLLGGRSPLAKRASSVAHRDTQSIVRLILDLANKHKEEGWEPEVIRKIRDKLDREYNNSSLYIVLLWLTGRHGDHGGITDEIDKTYSRITKYISINDPLVRWGTIWLAGMGDCCIDLVFQQTRKWLRTEEASDDRLVRMSYLWLAGSFGSPAQVDAAIKDSAKWLKQASFRDDACIRAARLVWLMRRGRDRPCIEPAVVQAITAEARAWLAANNDPLVHLALRLTEIVVPSP